MGSVIKHLNGLLHVIKLTNSRILTSRGQNKSNLVFTFDKAVTLYDSDFPGFDWVALLTDLGGSLGLWLGVGVAQVVELLLKWIVAGNDGQ